MHGMAREAGELLEMLDGCKWAGFFAALDDGVSVSNAQAFDLAEAEADGGAIFAPGGFVRIERRSDGATERRRDNSIRFVRRERCR
jgi:hypothetical protein